MSYCSSNKNSFLNYLDANKLFTFITTVTFIVIFIFIYILRVYTFFEKRKIPRAVHPTAPFGNIKDILFQNSPLYVYLWKYYNRFKRKGFRYGGFYLFFKPGILIVNPRLIEEILSEEIYLSDIRVVHQGNNDKQKMYRKLFNNETLEAFLSHYNDHSSDLLTDLREKCVTTVLYDFFMNTTCLSFGFKSSLEILHTINTLLRKKSRSNFLHYFYLVYPVFKINKSTPELQTYLKNIMEFRKKNDIREKDVIQGFIDLLNEGNCGLEETARELFDVFADNIIHSYSSALLCLYELAANVDVQQDVIGEIRRFRQKHKQVNLKNLEELVTLDMIVKETLRKYPPVPVIFKKCEENYRVSDFELDLPKGTFIFVSTFGVHRDPENFPDPEKFNPDRFSEENIKFIKPNTYIPFGFSSRKDIGLRFTMVHIKLGLLSILSSFKVILNNNHVLTFDGKKLPVCPEEPLPLSFEPL